MKQPYFVLCTVTLLLGLIAPFEGHSKNTNGKTTLDFVISARKLPNTGTVGVIAPDSYVDVEYIASPRSKVEIISTSILKSNHNPDWPEVFHIVYHPGKGQLFTFNVYDHNKFTEDVKFGYVTVSVGEMVSNSQGRLELDIVGPKKEPGKLLLFMKVNETLYENTESRLRNSRTRPVHLGGHYQYVD